MSGATPDAEAGRLRIDLDRRYPVPPRAAFAPLERIGGDTGYYYADGLWKLRSWLDRLAGGETRRGRSPGNGSPVPGERIDFWRVESVERDRLLRLRSEMRLPGEGWLQFAVEPDGGGSVVRLSASFDPDGWRGRAYWYALYPVHVVVFRGLLRNLGRHMHDGETSTDASEPRLSRPQVRPRQAERTSPCLAGCAAGGDVRGWITLVAQRRSLGLTDEQAYARAWSRIVERNPFPAITGRICPHPCEAGCNRHDMDGSVAVHLLERFLGDWAIERSLRLERPGPEARPESIGVVGAGPAGLSFAYQLARRGYAVTAYDAAPEPGGMLRYGIPPYRLPREVLDAEIARITDLGVDLRCGTRIGRDVSFEDLRTRHDVLFLGIGAHLGRKLGVPGEDGPGVWTGVDYLRRIHAGDPVDLGRRAVVVGGGDTAIDAARVARRAGTDVTLVYRRSRAEMPANEGEVDEAVEEGVRIEFHVAPVAIDRGDDGAVRAIVLRRMRPGEPDASGRARPVPVEGSEHAIETDAILAAVAQTPDWSELSTVQPDGPWIVTDAGGRVDDAVWSGGDATGLGIAAAAIGHGRRAAEEVDARLRGVARPADEVTDPIRVGPVKPDHDRARPRNSTVPLAPEARMGAPDVEVHAGLDETRFLAEVERCLSCGSCMGCRQCWMYCAHDCFAPLEEVRPGAYFAVSLDRCRACGKCVDLCPCGYLEQAPAHGA